MRLPRPSFAFLLALGLLAGCRDTVVVVRSAPRSTTGPGAPAISEPEGSGFGDAIVGSGHVRSETRRLGAFDRIEVSANLEADVKIGSAQSVVVEADDNILPKVRTEVSHGTLSAGLDGSISTTSPIKLHITVPRLSGVTFEGSSEGQVTGIGGSQFDAHVSGASHLIASGSPARLLVEGSGSSETVFDGLRADSVQVDLSGDSQAEITGTSREAKFQAEGSSEISLTQMDGGALTATLSGNSSLKTSGQVASASIQTEGSAQVEASKMNAGALQVEASGASSVLVGAVRSIEGEASGSAHVDYSGSPSRRSVTTTGAASIESH